LENNDNGQYILGDTFQARFIAAAFAADVAIEDHVTGRRRAV
jgi:hypothetical protein